MPKASPHAAFAIEGLEIRAGHRTLVHGVEVAIERGAVTGLVGPSGSGKTLTCRAMVGLVDLEPGVMHATLTVPGHPDPYAGKHGARRGVRDRAFRAIRGAVAAYLPQHAFGGLDPTQRVRAQVRAAARLAGDDNPSVAAWLARAGFADADLSRVARLFPHQLSGGMAQRVALARVLARRSPFLIADEPMTGLDLVVQRQLARQWAQLAQDGMGILVVTHDLDLLRDVAQRTYVMDQGHVAEVWDAAQLANRTGASAVGRRLWAST